MFQIQARSDANLAVIEDFVAENSDAFGFLAADKAVRSNTSVCMTVNMEADKLKQMIAWCVLVLELGCCCWCMACGMLARFCAERASTLQDVKFDGV